ncbi:MAG TPA: LamG-like jellyroll fold domain-containing protein [Terriglobia bacterium]|nr:LamG-like jellyroll fold domain-containing protein [Terriglobia bacterium]
MSTLLFFAPFHVQRTSAQTTALGTLAASMPQGSWAELATNNMAATLDNTGGSSGMTLPYSDDAVWDPVSKQLFFVGGDHNPIPCYPRFVSYTDSTNSWQILPQPSWFPCQYPMHGYHHTAIDPANGKLYHRPFNNPVVRKYDIASQTWTDLPAIPSSVINNLSCCTGVTWFPERNALIYASFESGANGVVAEYSESTGQWHRIAGSLPMGPYHNIALYNPLYQVVLFGGGNGDSHLYKLDSAGHVTTLQSAPIPIGIGQSVVTVDPVSGKYLIAGNSNDFYVYDVVADIWQRQSGAAPIFGLPAYTPPVHGIVAAPLSTYGVTMFVRCYVSNCHTYLYKHYADTTPPSISISSPADSSVVSGTIFVSADTTDNAGVVGVQFKLDGNNLGAEVTGTLSSYSVPWETTTAINKSYTLAAVARDAAGNHTTSTVSVTVNNAIPFGFSLSTGGDKTVTQGQSVSNTITASAVAGTIQPISFSVSGLPSGTTPSFSLSSCAPAPNSCTSTLNISTSVSTPTGSYPITVTGTATASHTASFILNVYAVNASFADKCNSSNVLSCFSFDSASSLYYTWPTGTPCDTTFAGQSNYTFGNNRIGPSNTSAIVQNGQCVFPEIDTATSHTGNGSLKFTIPSNSGPNSSGFFTEPFKRNSDGTFPYIGPGSPLGNVFYFQFYQKFDSNFLSTNFQCVGGTCGGFKQAIWYGNPPFGSSSSSIESTMYNGFQRGVPQMYGQQGSDDYGIQDAIGCTYAKATSLGGGGSGFDSQPNYFAPLNPTCIHYAADQWMEFTGRIEIRGASNAPTSRIQLWINGQLAVDYGLAKVNWAGSDGNGFGQFMLTPYSTGKDPNQIHPIGNTWYDDVIVSTQPIPMVNGGIPTSDTTPPTITNVSVSNITSTSATLTWTSDEPANSQVEYGIKASYGIQSNLDTSLVSSHSVTIPDLLPGTLYYYTVKSRDAAGNLATSGGLTFTTVSGGNNPSPLINGLTGYWALDEGSGGTTADSAGNNNGSLVNNPSWITGKVRNALQFNATDNSNDTDDPRVWIGRSFDVPSLPFTVSAWINPTDFADYRVIFSKRDTVQTMRFDLGLEQQSGRVYLANPSHLTFIYSPPTNTWTHLAVVASSTDTKLYVNGTLQQTVGAFTLGTSGTANTAIGGTGEVLTGDDDPFKGAIDEVRIYNRALSPSEIQLAPDTYAPVSSGITTSNITPSGATISWTTNEKADSQVDYGTTSSYGQSTTLNPSLSTAHSVNLSGLSSSTTYHFTVKSRDGTGNSASSQDYTFTTAALPVITLSPATVPDATVGVAYNQTITASGGFSPYTFSVPTGALPAGLTLNASAGTITGTPATPGYTTFTIQAVDSLGYSGDRYYSVNTANLVSDNVVLTLTGQDYDSEPSTDPPLVGRLLLSFNMTNIGPAITSPVYFVVTDLHKLYGDQNPDQPDLLLSADNHAGTVGDWQTLTMGPLPHDGTAAVYPPLVIGIGSRQPFELYVDLYTSPSVSPMMASDSGVLKAAPDNAPGRLLGRFKFAVSEATLNPPGTGPLVSVPPVPPGPNPGPSGNVGVITGPGSQSRPAVAVDPILPAHMAVASNDSASGSVRVSTTQNSGETWYTTILSRTLGNQTFFGAQDPGLAFDSLGKLSVVYTLSNLNDSSSAIVISESSDGINFNPPAAISFHLASDQIIDSRPVVAIKSGAGRYVAWDSLSLATSRYSINLARSEEGGLFGPVTTVVSNSLVGSPALAVNKSRVHIGWDNWGFNSVPPYKTGGSLMMTSSPNGAHLNFATPLEIAGTGIGFSQRIPAMPEKGVKPNLNLAVDPNDDSHIYAVFADRGNGMDIRLAGSTDQGKTWQAMTVSNDGTLADQFSPSVAVDSNSYPYVSFYDTRLSSTFEAADLFMATFSTGNSFDTQRISTVSSNDSQKNPLRDLMSNLGDRTALAMTPDYAVAAWTDTRLNSEDVFLNMAPEIPQQPGIPKLTWNNPLPVTYGTPLGATQLNASTQVAGAFIYNPPAGMFLDAGVHSLSLTFKPSDTLHYTATTATVEINVLRAPLTVTATSVSRIYGAPNPPLAGTLAGVVNRLAPDNITAKYTTSATMKSSVGKYPITPTVSDPDKRLSNYTVNLVNGTLEVLPAPLAVTANSASRFYGSPNPDLTGSIVGVVNGDNIRPNYGTLATIGSMPGNYAISAIIIDPNHRLPNYNVTITNSILTVVPGPIITLSATNPDPDDDNQRPQNRSSLRVPFGDQDLLSTSKAVTVRVGNIGTADLIISGLDVEGTGAGDFALTNKCGKTVAAGSNCTFTVAFTPSVLARRAAVITLTDNAGGYPGSEQKVNSSGNGVLSYAGYATSTACQAIALSDNASTDSFDSSRGSYADTKSDKRGDIAVNGNAALSERATVNGIVYSLNPAAGACKNGKPGISVSGKAEATGGYRLLEAPVAFATPSAVTPGTSDLKVKNDTPLRPGKYSDINVDGRAKLILSPGTYDINSLKLTGGAKITVAGEGQVILNIAGLDTDKPLQLNGESTINPFGKPANFLLRYGGRAQIDLGGQVDSYAIIYAPNAPVRLGGKADWYGALVMKTLEIVGSGGLHYDRDLGR